MAPGQFDRMRTPCRGCDGSGRSWRAVGTVTGETMHVSSTCRFCMGVGAVSAVTGPGNAKTPRLKKPPAAEE